MATFHATGTLFDDVPDASSWARKRHGSALLWRFDDPEPLITRMLELLRESRLFSAIEEISEREFRTSRSYGV